MIWDSKAILAADYEQYREALPTAARRYLFAPALPSRGPAVTTFVLERAPGVPYANARAQAEAARAAGYPPAPIDEREWEVVGFHGSMQSAYAHMTQSFEGGNEVVHRVIPLDRSRLH